MLFSFFRLFIALLCLTATGSAYAAKPRKEAATKPVVAAPAAPQVRKLSIAYLTQATAAEDVQPYFQPLAPDEGIQGARLGIVDDNTTGRFTQQVYELKEVLLPVGADATMALRQLLADGHRHVLLNLPGTQVAELSRLREAQDALIYNVGSSDDALRAEQCGGNLLHLLPSRAMRADALAQYLAKKRWSKLFLAIGPSEEDRFYGDAVKRAARRFGLKIVAEKIWHHSFDHRRTPESEVPVFTQGPDHDVVVVVDERGQYGDYFPFRTWSPRPVVGTHGLVPSAWHYTLEHWGALQLQKRFREQAGRWMSERDYAAWLAVRAIGEAATRAKSMEFAPVKAYLQSEAFSLAGFKGVPFSFRPWDGQLRQPILLTTERALVAVAPIEGYLHPKNELDTLGYDEAETRCRPNP